MQAHYHSDTTLGAIEGPQPGSIRYMRYSSGQPAPSRRIIFEENVVMFIDHGAFRFHHGNASFTIGRQQFASFRKNIVLEQECIEAAGACILIMLKKDWLTEFTRIAPLSPIDPEAAGPVMVSDINIKLLLYAASLNAYLQDEDAIAGNLARIKAQELLFWLSQNDPVIFQHLLNERYDHYSGITAVVEANVLNNLSVKELARLSGRSVSSFRREFRYIYNQTPTEWFRRQKLEKARELLAGTTMTITDICYTLGFESVPHFSRLYKSRFGCPPSKQRERWSRTSGN